MDSETYITFHSSFPSYKLINLPIFQNGRYMSLDETLTITTFFMNFQ